ncbi:MAG: SDR family NAD(P)-dependent oxidoreductase [Thiohalospira sp.]
MKNVALITGASSGIGKELALIHADQKGDLVIVARRKEELESLKKEIEKKYKVDVKIIVKDLTRENAPSEIYNELQQDGIEVDYLINNAGFGGLGKFHEREWAKDESMIKLNIFALTSLTRLFLPDFVKRNRGRILNVSSTASLIPGPLQAVYYATKAYVTSFSNAIAEELYDTKVTVTALLPGATETEFGKISGMDKTSMFQSTASAREVAEDGYKAMMQGKLNKISGLSFGQNLMMAFVNVTPTKMIIKQVRKMQEVR